MRTDKPLSSHQGRCRLCQEPIVFARTVASERGRGGKAMPLDPMPNPEGNVAVRDAGGGHLRARTLAKDETHDRTVEVLAMPHFATCGARTIAKEAETFLRELAEGSEP